MAPASGKRFLVFIGVSLGIIAIIGSLIFYILFWKSSPGESKEILIPKGASNTTITNLLHKENIIESKRLFRYLVRFTGGERKLRAGEYRFRTQMRPLDALFVLYYGEQVLHTVTIPEGYNARQIAELIEKAGVGSKEEFLKIVFSSESAKKYNLNSPSLEGYLFPDTYSFSKIDSNETIVDRMVQEFFKRFDSKLREETKKTKFTLEQLVTLASIVEKETGAPEERALVASVFHNRLKKRMRLESDPTIIYGIENFDGDIKFKDIRKKHPYNTYVIRGLPPGPIANPGYDALVATLRPAESDYLFFVGNNTGKHVFSETYNQHLKLVRVYQGRGRSRSAKNETSREPKSLKKNTTRKIAGQKAKR